MSREKLTIADYPLAEKRPELVHGAQGKGLDDLTVDGVTNGAVEMADLRITPQALRRQAEIARDAGRAALAANFERAAEMTALPQAEVMRIYEMLRPGRASDRQALVDVARRLEQDFNAPLMAAFVTEAADVYERRGLFKFRY